MDGARRLGRRLGCPFGKKALTPVITLSLGICIAWGLMMFTPWGWHSLDTFVWDFHISLYSLHVEKNPLVDKDAQKHPESSLFLIFDHSEEGEVLWLQEARWKLCQKGVSLQWCDLFTRLQMASWLVAWTVTFQVCCLILGVAAAFNFFYIKPRVEFRKWAKAYLWAGPTAANIALIGYYYMTCDFAKLSATSVSTFGMVFYGSCLLGVFSFFPVVVLNVFAFSSPTAADLLGDDSIDNDHEVGYGATASAMQAEQDDEDQAGAGVGFGLGKSYADEYRMMNSMGSSASDTVESY